MGLFDVFKNGRRQEGSSKEFLNKYKILNIKGLLEDLYGETVIIEANPLERAEWGGISVVEGRYEHTKYFIIPKSMVNAIVQIARSGEYWIPNMSEFRLDEVFSEDWNRRIPVFRHRSFK